MENQLVRSGSFFNPSYCAEAGSWKLEAGSWKAYLPMKFLRCKKMSFQNIFFSNVFNYYTYSDVFLADSVDLPDISDFFADILTFFHGGWEN